MLVATRGRSLPLKAERKEPRLIVEELLLLLRRTDGKLESGVQAPRLGMTGALLSDLALRGIVKFDDDAKNPRVRVVDSGASLNDPVLDVGVEAFRKLDGKKVSAVVSARGVDPT